MSEWGPKCPPCQATRDKDFHTQPGECVGNGPGRGDSPFAVMREIGGRRAGHDKTSCQEVVLTDGPVNPNVRRFPGSMRPEEFAARGGSDLTMEKRPHPENGVTTRATTTGEGEGGRPRHTLAWPRRQALYPFTPTTCPIGNLSLAFLPY